MEQYIWVSDEAFRRLRLRSLQAAREATCPVAATTYARLLLERQGALPATDGSPALFASTSPGVYEGVDGVMRVIDSLPESVYPPHSGKARSCLPAYATIRQKCSMNYWQPVRLSGRGKKNWVKMTAWWHCIYRNMLQNRSLPPKRIRRIVRRCNKR
ncbi:hypothetical protein ACLK19_11175 [Escherichia coli]